ncbi:chemotaxis protein CheW [Mobilitalea sibirica]|uniref:Chemotaxis protein CheW n=1 Tax=Mobilitalea sibirica TaxID=1462919 RepID=A0A8J7HC57_9FIRM|nr:chemotaxis protein CheW [Mobilitalea sibirica]MBH1942436.1 chemotaxis protein CheW [Mobilitalea sibirica]
MQSMKQAVFKIGEEDYGLDIMDVNTVEKVISMEQAKDLPENVKGIIKLRGDFIPVYSLRKKFGLADKEPDEETRLIITNSNGILMAYEVDKMQEIANITSEQVMDVPSIVKSKDTSYMKNVTNIKGTLVILLDHDKVLSEEEQNQIKKVIQSKK